MPFIKLQFKPGVNRDQTNYTNEGGWFACDKIRFRSSMPQKIGGWLATTTQMFVGVCRQMFGWITSYTDNFLALGTNRKVYINTGGQYYDITPIDTRNYTETLTNPFATTNGSSTLTVTDTNHGAQTGDLVYFSGASAVGGIPAAELNARHVITRVNANSYTITVATSATSTVASGGGTVQASYVIDAYILNGPFAATNGSSVITVTQASHNREIGEFVTFAGVSAGGLGGNITQAVLQQMYEIASTPTNNTYTIIAKNPSTGAPVVANASDSGNGGTSVLATYQIPPGNEYTVYGYGWGTGNWGIAPWGLATDQPIVLLQRDWWFDQFDNDLVMNIRNGEIYYWQRGSSTSPSTSLETPAVRLSTLAGASDVPDEAMQVLVSQNDKHLLAFGCTPFGGAAFDPLLIRWASQDEPQLWTPSSTNSAGFIRLSRGSQIIRAMATRQEVLVWTESSLYSLQYLGTLDVFGVQEYADNISIIGPRAVASANNVTYWMGQDKFYAYAGRVETLPCSLRNYVFNDINFGQVDQIICGTNEGFHEVWWMYCSANSVTVDRYVIYNYLERIWYYGTIARTAWLDSPLRIYPQAAGYEGILYDHERGVNADTLPMESYIQSSDFDIDDGFNYMLTKRVIPDVSFDGSSAAEPEVTFTMRPRNFPGSAYIEDMNDARDVIQTSVDVYTEQVFIRARARQMALKISSDGLGVQWQLGSPRLDARPDGRR
jgi:hypothetical protein